MSGIIGSAGSKSGIIGTTELDYEEGTWVVLDSSGVAYTQNVIASYTKIGRQVYFNLDISSTGSTSGSGVTLPFTTQHVTDISNWCVYGGYSTSGDIWGHINNNNASFNMYILSTTKVLAGRIMLSGIFYV